MRRGRKQRRRCVFLMRNMVTHSAETGDYGGRAPPSEAAAGHYPADMPAEAISDAGTDANPAPVEAPATSEAAPDALKPDDAEAGEWKPYEDDPAKSDEENAAARAEND